MMLNQVPRDGACAVAVLAIGAMTCPAPAGGTSIQGLYGWEDGDGTILGSIGAVAGPENVGIVDGIIPYAGRQMLRVWEDPHGSGTPEVFLAFVENLEHGDQISAGFFTYDETPGGGPGGFPSVRIWGRYAVSGEINNHQGSAGGNLSYSQGAGWEELSHSWTFDDGGGTRDALIVHARIYSTPANCKECSTPYYFDDLFVDVASANPNATILLPDGTVIGDPPRPKPDPCPVPDAEGEYGWEDGKHTILGSWGSVVNPSNVGPTDGVEPNSGERMLRVTEAPHAGHTPEVWVAFIENLSDGDEITAGAFLYDDGAPGSGQMRLWAHYAVSGDVNSHMGSASGNFTYTSGIGWEEIDHTWVFDSDGGTRDALVVQVRLYSDPPTCPECSTDYFIDDVRVEACAADPSAGAEIVINFPGDLKPDPGPCPQPDPAGVYGWEDAEHTIIGSFGAIADAANVGPSDGTLPNGGDQMLRVTETPHGPLSPAPHVWVAFIEHLEDGDVVEASAFLYDDGAPGSGQMRLWAHYGLSGEPGAHAGGTGEGSAFTAPIGWQEMSHAWEFDSAGGTRDALMIEVRLYSDPPDCAECSTDYFIDDVTVNVCSQSANVTIGFPDTVTIPEPQPPCPDPDHEGAFDWGDGESTIIGSFGNVVEPVNVGPAAGVVPKSGGQMLRVTEQPHGAGTPEVWVAFIENLADGDEITASAFLYDDGAGGQMRIWAHYGITGNPGVYAGGAGGNTAFTSGVGWEEMSHTWVFDSNLGQRDALMIEVRLYSYPQNCPECSTDYYIDDLSVRVCTPNPNVTIGFPDTVEVPEPPDACEAPDQSAGPVVSGQFGWEDGKSTILGYFLPNDGANLAAVNIGADEGPVASGSRALRLTEAPHNNDSPRVYVAFIENLVAGDLIHASFHAYDETPGVNPVVRIWGKYAFTGDVDSFAGSAGGNDVPTSGIGWEEICHTWVFNPGTQFPPRDALVVEVRLYSDPPLCPDCSTDYFIDDVEVVVWGNPDATITFADGIVIDEPMEPCPGDLAGDGGVGVDDLLMLLAAWGECANPADCPEDLTSDGSVGVDDLLILLANWGECPP